VATARSTSLELHRRGLTRIELDFEAVPMNVSRGGIARRPVINALWWSVWMHVRYVDMTAREWDHFMPIQLLFNRDW